MRFPTRRRRGSPEGWQGENPKSEEQKKLRSRPLLRMRQREQDLFCTLFHKKYAEGVLMGEHQNNYFPLIDVRISKTSFKYTSFSACGIRKSKVIVIQTLFREKPYIGISKLCTQQRIRR